MRKLIFKAAKQAKHTWYLSLFLRDRNLRPSKVQSESKFTSKVFSRQNCVYNFKLCVNKFFLPSKGEILHLTKFL